MGNLENRLKKLEKSNVVSGKGVYIVTLNKESNYEIDNKTLTKEEFEQFKTQKKDSVFIIDDIATLKV